MFFPVEPPRPAPNRRESFARITHRFAPNMDAPSKNSALSRGQFNVDPETNVTPPEVRIDCRLPDPAIVTCTEALPLRILVENRNGSPATIYLQSINVALVATTRIRAHQLARVEETSWTILSTSQMRLPLTNMIKTEEGSKVFEIDSNLWKQHSLPNTVAPSFNTCNIGRKYELFLQVGLSWGSHKRINVGCHPASL